MPMLPCDIQTVCKSAAHCQPCAEYLHDQVFAASPDNPKGNTRKETETFQKQPGIVSALTGLKYTAFADMHTGQFNGIFHEGTSAAAKCLQILISITKIARQRPAVNLYAKEKLDKICHILYNLTRNKMQFLVEYCLNS